AAETFVSSRTTPLSSQASLLLNSLPNTPADFLFFGAGDGFAHIGAGGGGGAMHFEGIPAGAPAELEIALSSHFCCSMSASISHCAGIWTGWTTFWPWPLLLTISLSSTTTNDVNRVSSVWEIASAMISLRILSCSPVS